jgi:hypothetical protein
MSARVHASRRSWESEPGESEPGESEPGEPEAGARIHPVGEDGR